MFLSRIVKILTQIDNWFATRAGTPKPDRYTYDHFGLTEEQIEYALDLEDEAIIARIRQEREKRHRVTSEAEKEKPPGDSLPGA